jgi:hemoglobin/transferrin/lactoferrin receptor protein
MKADKGIYFATLSYAHSDSEYVSSNNDDVIVGSSLENQVGDSVALSLGLTSEETGLSVLWTSLVTFDLDAKTNSDRDKKGYDVHNINLQWTPKSMQDLTITAGIENIFNKEYVSHASVVFEEEGFDRPGSSFASDYEPGVNYKIQAAYKF